MAGASTGLTHVKNNRLKAIAVGWDSPLDVYPNASPINTVLPKFRAVNLQMISVPANTPAHIIEFWNKVYRMVAETQEAKEHFTKLSVINTDATVEQSAAIIKEEYNRIRQLKHLIKVQ